ncbi:right-handed parallel beta-helix repeat-containing protein [Limobrevibacterium gyesilva]|uniref:Right-handed parallel beta-helix repeat-containing protein n=1 Tax=Limobrevibacterium gyesilva TaxID=2991712 RepID=A0AA42CCS4_9PROT|nr:right-handed parallel beta-helix repeat-containing protein [Limobrevibacterium gyesilva]MCW3473883.1 right-handed parallel beta-helix repeat-containing protein [Limobrevibacterium gyesilva]
MTQPPDTPHCRPRSQPRPWLWLLAAFVVAATLDLAVIGFVLGRLDRTPREWAAFLAPHADRGGSMPARVAAWTVRYLDWADRIDAPPATALPDWIGASPARSWQVGGGRVRDVGSTAALAAAVNSADPGDVILLRPGAYRLDDIRLRVARAGTAEAPITLRADRLGAVVIESAVDEAIKVSAPYWRFENLVIRGVCSADSVCEHAFHVVGDAHHTIIRNSRLQDFNAQVKINAESGMFPDEGIIEWSTLANTHVRDTGNPVTPIDLVAAKGWRISDNLIADFVKAQGNSVSYGAFAKGAAEDSVFERNVVLCEFRLRGFAGQRIGLSFGGGGSPPDIRRDSGRSGIEHQGGAIRDNLIAFCSDDGVYLNRAARARVEHNTLIDTAGIDARFVHSSAEISANVVDGVIRQRDQAQVQADANRSTRLLLLFLGLHPQRGLFADPAALDLAWRDAVPRQTAPAGRRDLCGAERPGQPAAGAFEDFAACLRRAPAPPQASGGG